MEFDHTSVLLGEVIEYLQIKPEGTYVDGTLGGGGHGREICSRLSQRGTFIGIDRDKEALAAAEKNLESCNCRKILVHENFENIEKILERENVPGIDGAVLDLGVSSYQLDKAERGFSYMNPGRLDMRMNEDDSLKAYEIVNFWTGKELEDIIRRYGEERWARRIAEFITEARKKGPVETTGELVDIIKKAIPAGARRDGPHPAKRTFQAIRIAVNDELGQLERSIEKFIDALNPGGRLCVISFHSLEDRIIKEAYNRRLNPCTCPKEIPVCICGKTADVRKVVGKPILPTAEEIEKNHRARSAKLRIIEKR